MRHRIFGKKLNRDIKERKRLFRSLITSLITYGKVKTSLARAKAIVGLTEKLVTLAKESSERATHQISALLPKKETVERLKTIIAPRFKDKIGGYLRLVRIGRRPGDGSEEVILEWSKKEEKEKGKK